MAWEGRAVLGLDHGLPEVAAFDVAVVGGGAAGVAAAETAARHGLSVLLIERYGFCGGNAVAGLSGTICGLYLSTERGANRPEQAVFGFAERFRAAMERAGGLTAPQRYGATWTVTHDPLVWREVGEGFLVEAGVRVLYHTMVTGVVMEGETVRGLVVDSKAGRGVVRAKRVIDASGDGDVVFRAGLGFTMGQDGTVQNPTMIFRLAGVDVPRFLAFWGPDTISGPEVQAMLKREHEAGRYDLPRDKIWLFATPRPGEILCNATRLIGGQGRMLDTTNPWDLTEAEFVGRRQVREYARFLRDHVPGLEASFVNDTGVQAGIRQSRSILGTQRLTNEDVTARRKRADGIARSPWPIELHVGDRPKLEWLHDDFYEVPYGALVPEVGEHLITAGRCLSAEHEALASCRVTAQCFSYGQAAGLATLASLRDDVAYRAIDGPAIRAMLNDDGARLEG